MTPLTDKDRRAYLREEKQSRAELLKGLGSAEAAREVRLRFYTQPPLWCVYCQHEPRAHDRMSGSCFFNPGTTYAPRPGLWYPGWEHMAYRLTLNDTDDLEDL